MSQTLTNPASPYTGPWAPFINQFQTGAAYLLPLRIFIGLGWLRAGIEKALDPTWIAGDQLPLFFQTQIESGAVHFPIYESLILHFFSPNALMLSWIILIGELLAGAAILSGTVTNLALLGGLFMNLNFVLAGVVNPSAFYIGIQGALLASGVGTIVGGDALLSRFVRSSFFVAQPHLERSQPASLKWIVLLGSIGCCIAASLATPYIRDFGPHSIDDPAMLLFITLMLGALLGGILFIRLATEQSYGSKLAQLINPRNVTALANASVPTATNYRRFVYPGLLVVLYAVWLSYMTLSESWYLFVDLWPISLTMTLGSFVAGATAEGGAAIAFPVFTKVLHIAAPDARTFGLMIQAVGMTMAGVVIWVKQVKVLPQVILWASLGGVIGQVAGAQWLTLPPPYPKILFTFTAAVFGFTLLVSRWGLKWEPRESLHHWGVTERCTFAMIGILGGAFASVTGSGIDMLTFIVLTLAFGLNEKISTPTTVIIMALNSIVGFAVHGLILQDIGVAWDYWLVAIPIVVIGAPMGAVAASYLKRDHIILFLVSLILLELVTTILLVPFSPTALRVTAMAVALCSITFGAMLIYRQKSVARTAGASEMRRDKTHPAARPEPTITRLNPFERVSCNNCYRTQDAANGDCMWCGVTLAFAEPIPDAIVQPQTAVELRGGNDEDHSA